MGRRCSFGVRWLDTAFCWAGRTPNFRQRRQAGALQKEQGTSAPLSLHSDHTARFAGHHFFRVLIVANPL